MFHRNDQNLQWPLFGGIDSVPKKQQECLEKSWAGILYREFSCCINQESFAAVYSDEDSRPNIPVNVLVGFETLKAGFGWSDEEACDHFSSAVQARYALGYRDLSEGQIYRYQRGQDETGRAGDGSQKTAENPREQVGGSFLASLSARLPRHTGGWPHEVQLEIQRGSEEA
jgi:hypothetical protein